MPSPILVIGIGNEYRGDGATLMEAWKAAPSVIVIDAASSGRAPGTIHRFDAVMQPIPTGFSFHSTHAFGVAEAIGLAHALQQLPPRLIVYAIEGKNFTAGVGLSPRVAKAVQKVIEQISLPQNSVWLV